MSDIDEFGLLQRLIKGRRTIRDFTPDPVEDGVIAEIIDTAVWAPNHRSTEPWRFVVLRKGGEKRPEVANMVHDWTLANTLNPNRAAASAADAKKEILNAPALVYVFALPGTNAEVSEENYAATACAVQNLLLGAQARGLAVGWSTGRTCKPENVREVLGVDAAWKIVGCLFIGYPAVSPEGQRKPGVDVTTWL
ncbi:MAG: nitroreductase [Chloroflexi bacterium]|nr:nitroreductase [Chloroflexota bacterium]